MIPKQLQNKEFRFCLLAQKSKKPIEYGWSLDYANWELQQNKTWKNKETGEIYKIKKGTPYERLYIGDIKSYKFDDPKLLNHIKNGRNYGCVGGWGGLWVLDSDMDLTEELIEKNFPKTNKVLYHHKNMVVLNRTVRLFPLYFQQIDLNLFHHHPPIQLLP